MDLFCSSLGLHSLALPKIGGASEAKQAIKRKTGARGLRSIMENILLNIMYDLPELDGVKEVIINADVIEDKKDPVFVYNKMEKTAN